jgi:sugar lactone lactonase YvrE
VKQTTSRTGTNCSSVCCTFAVLCLFASGIGAQPVVTFDPTEVPVGVAVDKVGDVWVSLQPQCQIRRYTPDWKESLRITLVNPCDNGAGTGGLAVDATGVLYATVVVRPDVRGVYVVPSSGAFYRLPGTENMVFPNAIAFDHNNGTMYVTDSTLGQVWRIPPGGSAELWSNDPLLAPVPIPGTGMRIGANGIAVDKGFVIVSVSFLPRLVKIPINRDGSAGTPEILVDFLRFFQKGIFALDDIALDVFGNIYASVVSGPFAVARVSPDGAEITTLGSLDAAVLSLAFGTGKGERKSLFVAINQSFGGTGSAIVRVDAGVPGRPIP